MEKELKESFPWAFQIDESRLSELKASQDDKSSPFG
jgi:hypothetical protein